MICHKWFIAWKMMTRILFPIVMFSNNLVANKNKTKTFYWWSKRLGWVDSLSAFGSKGLRLQSQHTKLRKRFGFSFFLETVDSSRSWMQKVNKALWISQTTKLFVFFQGVPSQSCKKKIVYAGKTLFNSNLSVWQ